MTKKRKSRRRWYVFTVCAFLVFGFYTLKYLRARTIIHKGVETKAIVLSVKNDTEGEALYTDYSGGIHELSGYIGKDRTVSDMIPLYYMGQKPEISVVPDDTLLPKAECSGIVTLLLAGYSAYVTIVYIRKKKELSFSENDNNSHNKNHNNEISDKS